MKRKWQEAGVTYLRLGKPRINLPGSVSRRSVFRCYKFASILCGCSTVSFNSFAEDSGKEFSTSYLDSAKPTLSHRNRGIKTKSLSQGSRKTAHYFPNKKKKCRSLERGSRLMPLHKNDILQANVKIWGSYIYVPSFGPIYELIDLHNSAWDVDSIKISALNPRLYQNELRLRFKITPISSTCNLYQLCFFKC